MKDGVMLIHPSLGELVDTKALIDGLKSGKIGYASTRRQKSVGGLSASNSTHSAESTDEPFAVRSTRLDVYEEEAGVFFHDLSDQVLNDNVLA
jgi:D-lactate dehydrogenase